MKRLAVLALGLAVALSPAAFAAPASAQQPDDLDRLLNEFTALWYMGDAAGLVELAAERGVEIELRGYAIGPLAGRRAAAALRHLFGAQQTVDVRAEPASRVAGADDRAFVEMIWEVRPGGAHVSEATIVFVGFVREGSRWKVSQIRILQ
jgi:hypothetical protein